MLRKFFISFSLLLLAFICVNAAAEITVMGPGTIEYDKNATWTVKNTQSGGEYRYYILDANTYSMLAIENSSSNKFTYSFVTPGNYLLVVNYINGSTLLSKTIPISMKEDGQHLTVKQKAKSLVDTAKGKGCTGQYTLSLWLHDWIINNSYYDETETYCSAQDILFRGKGVCNAYTSAYKMLLDAAGIENYVVSGAGHSWNAAKIDGVWCHIDVTWDDPLVSGKPAQTVTGREGHYYFGLDDETMLYDHVFSAGSIGKDAFKNNYFIRSGFVDTWLGKETNTSSILYKTKQYVKKESPTFEITVSESYMSPLGYTAKGSKQIVYSVVAYALSTREWVFGDKEYICSVTYINNRNVLSGSVSLFDPVCTVLPSALKEICDEAFSDNDLLEWVIIPAGAKSIGDRAFADCASLCRLDIPRSVTEIGEDILSGSVNVLIRCEKDSSAQRYAEAHDLPYQLTEFK